MVFPIDESFTALSISAGLVWDFAPGYNVGISVSRSERAPSASELLSFGPHIGTSTYEVGALFALHEEEGEAHIELGEGSIELETANNIDLTLRKTEGNLGFVLNAFYNQMTTITTKPIPAFLLKADTTMAKKRVMITTSTLMNCQSIFSKLMM